jgi:hypothetical protein
MTIFFAAVSLTEANFWADSADYVDSVIAFRLGENYNFWEFGHLFWRPFGSFTWSRFFSAADSGFWRGEVNLIFQWMSCIAGLVSTVTLIGILKKLQISIRNIAIVSAGFVCSHALLNFTQTGTSYVTALMFYFSVCFSFCVRQLKNLFYIRFYQAFVWRLQFVFGCRFFGRCQQSSARLWRFMISAEKICLQRQFKLPLFR